MTEDLKSHIAKLDIQELRLMNGDHILAEVIWDKESDDIVIKDPLLLSGDKSVTEWFAFTEDQYFSIDKSSIIASGGVNFNSKVYFCRLVLTRNIKTNLLSGNPQSQEDIDMLREVAAILGQEGDIFISDVENEFADDEVERLYTGWQDDVDDTKIH